MHRFAAVVLVALASPTFADTTPQSLPFTQDWSNPALITVNDDWSGVPGVVGYRGAGLTSLEDVDPQTLVAPTTESNVDVNANQAMPDTFTTGGVTEFEITNPVVALTGSGGASAPHIVITLDTTGVDGVRVRYNVRDVDGSVDDAAQQVALQYRVGTTGDFTNVPAGYIADATEQSMATKVTAINVVLPAAVDNQPVVQLRIITTNADGSDEWIGIDDIEVLSATTNPTAVGMSSPASAMRGAAVTVTASVTPGDVPASTGITVACDLSSIGGSATQSLFDDGSNGDGMSGDNVWTFATTVGTMNVTAGMKTFGCTVSDAEQRSSTFNIMFEVAALCGDGVVEGTETCDDQGTMPGDGCSDTCAEETGYDCTGMPSVCADIDECTDNTDDCSPNAACANTAGSYTCTCMTGYTGNGMGANGCADLDECMGDTDDCVTAATCNNTPGAFTCACPAGYDGDGRTSGTGCTDLDECMASTDDCVAEASCANTDGAFTCTCADGFTGDGRASGTGCADADECGAMADTCDANASCTNTSGGFTCMCNTGYTGDGMTCADVDECATGADNCDPNATCANTAGSFSCACPAGFSGDGVTCTEDAEPEDDGGGCCSSSTNPSGVALLVMVVIAGLRRRQRR